MQVWMIGSRIPLVYIKAVSASGSLIGGDGHRLSIFRWRVMPAVNLLAECTKVEDLVRSDTH